MSVVLFGAIDLYDLLSHVLLSIDFLVIHCGLVAIPAVSVFLFCVAVSVCHVVASRGETGLRHPGHHRRRRNRPVCSNNPSSVPSPS